MKRVLRSIALACAPLFATGSYALTGDEALAKFQHRMLGIGTMSGTISWLYQSGQGYIGNFKYMAPGRIFVKFTSPSGRVLVSNGKRLWVYESTSNICGVQDLARGGSGGISSMVGGYLAILTSQGSGGYTIKLKSAEKAYSDITLVLDGSFLLKKAVFNSRDGEGFSVTLSNVRTGESMITGLFDFNVPTNAQVVRNPLDVK